MDKLTDVFCHFGEDVGKHVEKAPKTGAQKNKPIAYYLRCCNFKASVAKFGHDAKGLALKKNHLNQSNNIISPVLNGHKLRSVAP
jgi:hypothetical protein